MPAAFGLLLLLARVSPVQAADAPEKWFIVKPAANANTGFMLRVDVNKPDRIYYQGEKMTVTVRSEKACYLYLLYFSGERAACLFPNPYQTDNAIPAQTDVKVPGAGARFDIECEAPFGDEVLVAVATLKPVNLLGGVRPENGDAPAELSESDLKQMVVKLNREQQQDWAEARIHITTREKPETPATPTRHAVCIGVSNYSHSSIPDLQSSHADAQRLAEAFRSQCQISDVVLLVDEQATRANIEQAVFRDLPTRVQPGDTVFIVFSGHGWRVSDTNGDEQDGFDEVLVPHDGEMGEPDTMILDDTFARWMRELDGCQVALILDNCYSGGSSKSLGKLAKGNGRSKSILGADFFDGEMKRAKDLGQRGTMIIAACQANQLAWEMPRPGEGGVFTYHLLQPLGSTEGAREADKNGDGRLSVGEWFRHAEKPVIDYVRDKYQEEQTPLLLDNADDAIVVR
jgi:hypothetical protein